MPAQPARPPASQFDTVQDAPRWGGYWGTGGRDLLIGTEAGEQLTGEGGHDFLDAGGGDDRIYAGAGDDTVLAGAGNDSITGDDGNDWLEAGAGQDTIYAGEGDDTLSGGAGDGDVLSGGNGADTYIVRRGDGRDSIEGFYRADRDRLDLTDFASVLGDLDSFTKLKEAGRVTGTDPWGGDTIIRLTDTDQVTLRWVNPRDLTDDQFVFAEAPTNRAPTDILISASVIAENEAPGTVVGSLSAVDPDAGDTVRFSLLDDAGGAFALAEDGRSLVAVRSLDYEAGPASYAVTVRATDAGGLTTDTTLTITVRNVDEGVTAEADRYAAVEDTVLTVSAEQGVLANDRAPDGGRAAVAGTITTTLGGTVALAADGSFTYIPKADANGEDSFTYTLTDADGSTATGEVTLDVAAVRDPVAPVYLSDVAAGRGGFKIIGETATDSAGWSVSDAGDVNGDGFADLLVGARRNDAGGNDAGAAYLVFGKADTAMVDLRAVAAGEGGFKIIGENDRDHAGISVAAAGDVNGDGRADFLVGSLNNDVDGVAAGAAYLVYGKPDGAPIDLNDVAAGKGGFKIIGEQNNDWAGWSVTAVGDANGDGLGDLLVGAIRNDAAGNDAGAAYLIFGKAESSTVSLKDVAAGKGGFKIIGESADDLAGSSISALGDVNGDGLADFIMGSLYDDESASNAGAAYVVFGKNDTKAIDLKFVSSGAGGFKIIGENEGDLAGISVSGAGDVNGDGFADFIVGALHNDAGGSDAGAAYVVFGDLDMEDVLLKDVAYGKGGFKIIGEEGGFSGFRVAGAGDVDGDGRSDLLISSSNNQSAFLVFGKADTAAVQLDEVESKGGSVKIVSESSNIFANSFVSAAGDVNHDGLADIAIGYPAASSAYVVFGSQSWQA